jgi:hypothetical protein
VREREIVCVEVRTRGNVIWRAEKRREGRREERGDRR